MLNFPNANFSSEEWCYANDVSYGIIYCFFSKTSSSHKLKSGARFEVGGGGGEGGGTPLFAYTGQVCAAEQKALSIKQGVEFYYCSSKILIIYFIISIVKHSILIVNSLKSVVNSVFLG